MALRYFRECCQKLNIVCVNINVWTGMVKLMNMQSNRIATVHSLFLLLILSSYVDWFNFRGFEIFWDRRVKVSSKVSLMISWQWQKFIFLCCIASIILVWNECFFSIWFGICGFFKIFLIECCWFATGI